MSNTPQSRDDFEVAIVCALPLEYDAVSPLIDQVWDENGDRYGRVSGDNNLYTTGRMGNTNVVILLLVRTGKANAARAAEGLRFSYPRLRLVLLTGICGGAPTTTKGEEVLLGDVIISKSIVQHDFGRQNPDGFATKDTIEDALGRVASADMVVRCGEDRERLVERHHVVGFEMEGAGLWGELPCLVVKGVCDYADSHKHKGWQDFAAATAASTSKVPVEQYMKTSTSAPAISTDSDRLPYPTTDILEGTQISLEDLTKARYFVSWYSEAKFHAGAPGMNYKIGSSKLKRPGREFALEKVSFSVGQLVTGGCQFAIGRKDPYVRIIRGSYKAKLQWLDQKYVTLWDVVD
ncbi:hypothetical protein ACHAQH_001403 [Verticillium albo-atrum]